jgi:indole-3-glycerol phosphate synthase
MPTYLDAIVAAHRAAAAKDTRRLGDLADRVDDGDPPRGFADALKTPTLSVIAEIKRRSPSKGDLAPDLVPGDLAAAYEAGGASCLSVLTDADHFGGSAADLAEARSASKIPLLRKDFTVDVRDVVDARLMGADAVLLIVAALDDGELRRFLSTAYDLGIDALVEVHDEVELHRALELGATVVGVNQRDLTTFAVDHELAARLRPLIPPEVVAVAESGVRGADDAAALASAGYDAVLVGETLVTSADPAAGVAALRGARCS